MLIGFTCENYASYRERCVFSMEASSKSEYWDINTFDSGYGRLLKSAVIYGANASGKSNLFKALHYVRSMVGLSVVRPDLVKENEPFKFAESAGKAPSLFEVAFVINQTKYRYGFEILGNCIHAEWLYKRDKRETLLFERKGPSWETIILKGLMKDCEQVKKHTRDSSLFLSMAAIMNNKLAIEIIAWFDSISIVTPISNVSDTVEYMLQSDICRQKVLKYLKRADIGIEDFSFTVSNVNAQEEMKVPIEALADAKFRVIKETKEIDVKSKHAVFGADGRVVSQVELPFVEYQSQGTIRLFELLGPILGSLDKGRVVIVDELGAQLHPNLVRFILSLFNAIDTNSNNAQLVCNSHDALLLEERVRRDQIWFTQKNDVGESVLYSLDEFKDTRKDDPFIKKYLLGVFGATPQPNKGDF